MKLLIMGAGYIGMTLLRALQKQNHEIYVTTTQQEKAESLKPYAQHVLVLNPNEYSGLKEAIDLCDAMIILVAPKNQQNYKTTYLDTAKYVSNALKDRLKPFYILYTSSTSVYQGSQSEYVTENMPLKPQTENEKILLETELIYLNLETAVQGDKVMQGFNSESFVMVGDHSQLVKAPTITSDYGLKDCVNLSPSTAVSRCKWPLSCVLRLGGIYGPDRELVQRAQRLSRQELPGNGKESTNHIHRDDIVDALLFCLKNQLTGIYNLVNDDHPSRNELYQQLCKSIDIASPIWKDPGQMDLGYKVSNQKIKRSGFIFNHPQLS